MRNSLNTLIRFAKDADLLIHDAMYTQEEWNAHKGWGHSSVPNALQLGMDASVQMLVLFHHDPERTDKEEDVILKSCRTQIKKEKSDMVCDAAREGLEIEL